MLNYQVFCQTTAERFASSHAIGDFGGDLEEKIVKIAWWPKRFSVT